jgi:uncharacterized membrane protein
MFWWILGGLAAGAVLGEAVGRAYWFWGALVGALIGQAISRSVSGATRDEVITLRAQLDRLQRQLEALMRGQPGSPPPEAAVTHPAPQVPEPVDASVPEQRANTTPAATDAPVAAPIGASAALDARDAATVSVSPSPSAPVATPVPSKRRRLTDGLLGRTNAGVRDKMGTQSAEAIAAEIAAPAPVTHASGGGDVAPPPAGNPLGRLWGWLFGENAVVRIGIVILFLGVAFLLKYAYDRIQVPIELRLAGVAIGAIVMLIVGWRLRERRRDYALAMQGGAIGLLYLTVFGAFRVWPLIPAAPAFALLVAIALFAAVLAIAQDALILAGLGTAGGFLAPVLASTGAGSHVMLFSYYAVLNLGIVAIAWFKAWRSLNLLGFVFTFIIALAWGDRYYRPEHFATTEPFLIFHFLLYLAVPILFARQQSNRSSAYVDATLVFGVPIVGFGMQWALVRDTEYGLAISAIALAAVYLSLGMFLWHRARERMRLLVEAFLALGIIFATLAVPLALSGRWTSAAWAVEGAGLVWIGLRQRHLLTRAFGLLVQFGAAVFVVYRFDWMGYATLLEGRSLSFLLIALAALFTARQYSKHGAGLGEAERIFEPIMFVWGAVFWLAFGANESAAQFDGAAAIHAFVVFAAASAVAAQLIGTRTRWTIASMAAQALLPIAIVALFGNAVEAPHPFAKLGWIAWPIAIAAQYWLLRRSETEWPTLRPVRHALSLWFVVVFAAWELAWQIDTIVDGRAEWGLVAWVIVPVAALLVVALKADRLPWPVAGNRATYLGIAALPIAAFLLGWSIWASFASDGDPSPLPYVPVASPMDLAQIAALLAVSIWFLVARRAHLPLVSLLPAQTGNAIVGAVVFVVFNAILLRTVHHWAGVSYDLGPMLRSNLVQATLAIAWTTLALALMFIAKQRTSRAVWIIGAALLGVVVVKLLLLDLAQRATVERIVAFIGVGVLMLVIGYLAPLPPRRTEGRS